MGSVETWILVKPDGSLVLHWELDGAAALRRGSQPQEKPITLEEVEQRYPSKVREVAADALALLSKAKRP